VINYQVPKRSSDNGLFENPVFDVDTNVTAQI